MKGLKIIFNFYRIKKVDYYCRFGNQLPSSKWFVVYSLASMFCALAALCVCYASLTSIAAEEFTNDFGFITVSPCHC